MGKEVAADGGVGGEIFLEVAGKQALWHTPSWRVLRSSEGRRAGSSGVEGTRGWQGAREHGFLSLVRVGDGPKPGQPVLGVGEGGLIPPTRRLPQ